MTERTHPAHTPGADAARADVVSELWDRAAGVLVKVTMVLLLVFVVVALAEYATGSPVLEALAMVLGSWALLTLAALHAVDTQCRSLPWRLVTRRRAGGDR